jgi:hypothetical protein
LGHNCCSSIGRLGCGAEVLDCDLRAEQIEEWSEVEEQDATANKWTKPKTLVQNNVTIVLERVKKTEAPVSADEFNRRRAEMEARIERALRELRKQADTHAEESMEAA